MRKRKEIDLWIREVRAANRRAELRAGAFGQNRAQTIPDKRKEQSRRGAERRFWPSDTF